MSQTTLEEGELLLAEALRGGQMWSRVLKRGQTLKLTDVEGGASVAALFYNADLLLKAQHIARLTTGDVLYSDMGRVLCSVVADDCGWHDTITGHGDARSSERKYGGGSYQKLRNDFHRNTRDNFLTELAKYGMGKRDIVANVNFFVKVAVDGDGNLQWSPGNSRAGASVTLRAGLDTLIVLSNTPHPLDPSPTYAPRPVALEIRAVSAPIDEHCRRHCPENERGFSLTERFFL
jgi:urea carboxylase-associated protein 2